MGSRHNRRRTRSRPRNRNRSLQSQTLSFDSISTPPPMPQPLSVPYTGSVWEKSSWSRSPSWTDSIWLCNTPHSGASLTRSSPSPSSKANNKISEPHLQMFGGEVEDGMDLCDSMVQVMLDLFDGSVDFQNDYDVVYGTKK